MSKRKRTCLLLIIIFVLIPIAIHLAFRLYVHIAYKNIEIYTVKPEEVGEFSLEDYQEEIILFPCDRNIGSVESLDDVTYKAQTAWNERFCVTTIAGLHIPNSGEGIEVLYDTEEQCWLVKGTAPQDPLPPGAAGWTGYIPHVIIKPNGDVVAMWLG